MTYTATLQYRMSQTADPALQPTEVQVEFEILSVVGYADTGLFVFQIDVGGREVFQGVATPVDLQALPFNLELDGRIRRAAVTQVYPDGQTAETALDLIRTLLEQLAGTMTVLNQYGTPQTEVIPS